MGMSASRFAISRPKWNYSPVMWAYWRMCMFNLHEATKIGADGTPTDDALLARLWIATETSHRSPEYDFSFSACMGILGLNEDSERYGCLNIIDEVSDHDTDECDKRREYLLENPPYSDEDVDFDGYRVVPEVDQLQLAPGMAERLPLEDRRTMRRQARQALRAALADRPTPGAITAAALSLFEAVGGVQ